MIASWLLYQHMILVSDGTYTENAKILFKNQHLFNF